MEIRVIKYSDVSRCPKNSLLPAHYRSDGSCYCDSREAFQADVDRLTEELARARERLNRC